MEKLWDSVLYAQKSWLQFVLYDALAAVIWAFQAALPGFIGGRLVQDQPWLAMVFGFVLSALLAGGIALGQRWWDRRKSVEVEVPLKPAVVGIGVVDAKINAHLDKAGNDDAEAPTPSAEGAEAQEAE